MTNNVKFDRENVQDIEGFIKEAESAAAAEEADGATAPDASADDDMAGVILDGAVAVATGSVFLAGAASVTMAAARSYTETRSDQNPSAEKKDGQKQKNASSYFMGGNTVTKADVAAQHKLQQTAAATSFMPTSYKERLQMSKIAKKTGPVPGAGKKKNTAGRGMTAQQEANDNLVSRVNIGILGAPEKGCKSKGHSSDVDPKVKEALMQLQAAKQARDSGYMNDKMIANAINKGDHEKVNDFARKNPEATQNMMRPMTAMH